MITITKEMENLWEYLNKKLGNPYGASGVLGNFYAESKCNPKNLQDSANRKLKMTDEEYTISVDGGKYKNFKTDSAGYGLYQATSKQIKSRLFDYAKKNKKSIGDGKMQIDFLILELETYYPQILKILKTTKSVAEASEVFHVKFERPAKVNATTIKQRAEYGSYFYEHFKKGGRDMGKATADKLVATAIKEDGYIEKKSNKDLDSKTGNKGSSNFVKYQREIGVTLGLYWCCTYVCAMFKYAFGDTVAKKLLLGNYTASCEVLRQRFIKAKQYYTTPKKGDLIFFKGTRHAGANHIGIVTKVSGNTVYTEEGNASKSSNTDNGGMVCAKSYALSNTRILGYARPTYEVEQTSKPTPAKTPSSTPTKETTKPVTTKAEPAKYKDAKYKGTWKVTGAGKNFRAGCGTDKSVICVLPADAELTCNGYYNKNAEDTVWISCTYKGKSGYVSTKVVQKIK